LCCDSSESFHGREIREIDPGGGDDGCWNPGDPPGWEFDKVSGGSLGTTVGSEWGFDGSPGNGDYIGFTNEAIQYYRMTGRTGCRISIPQQMEIRCDDPRCGLPWEAYQTHWIEFGIESDWIWTTRQSMFSWREWF
jgi:hypothetical protein